jgi:hypothetical protein
MKIAQFKHNFFSVNFDKYCIRILLQAYINFQNEPVAAHAFELRSQAHSFAFYSGGSTFRRVFKANARSEKLRNCLSA